jgi:hypothetical protein
VKTSRYVHVKLLGQLFHAGASQGQMSKALQRQSGAIRSRLVKLHLGI